MKRIHILGFSNPAAEYLLVKLNNQKNRCYCYSNSRKLSLETKVVPYKNIIDNFKKNDYLISFIPIIKLISYLEELEKISKYPKLIIACSSTSVNSKVLSSSPDAFAYNHFLIGEHYLLDYYVKNLQREKHNMNFLILRLSMLWGGRKDKNINFIYEFLMKFGFFPLLGVSPLGKRYPLHHSYLSETIFNILKRPLDSGIYTLQGPEQIKYDDMISEIKDKIYKKTFLIKVPIQLLNLFLKISEFFGIKKLTSILMMISRQAIDLDFKSFNHIPNKYLPNHKKNKTFKQLLNSLY